MTERYTAADFANARFAQHEDEDFAVRLYPQEARPWESVRDFHTDEGMADDGWVPVPTKPTITASRFDEEFDPQWRWNVVEIQQKLEKLGIEIIPDPEPTNTERLTDLLKKAPIQSIDAWAEYLNDHGVTAPNVKGN